MHHQELIDSRTKAPLQDPPVHPFSNTAPRLSLRHSRPFAYFVLRLGVFKLFAPNPTSTMPKNYKSQDPLKHPFPEVPPKTLTYKNP